MTVFVIDINTEYSKYSIPIIDKFCKYNEFNLFVLDKNIEHNIHNQHPSWLKLFSHKLVDDDFILCWDLDLLPTKRFKLDCLDYSKINLCHDSGFINENFTFNGKFKYNCGLIGVPKTYASFFESIYFEKAQNSQYPSYEQYHVNDKIFDNKIDVNLLPHEYNYLYDGFKVPETVKNIHYTYKINSNEHRVELIKEHYNNFYEKI